MLEDGSLNLTGIEGSGLTFDHVGGCVGVVVAEARQGGHGDAVASCDGAHLERFEELCHGDGDQASTVEMVVAGCDECEVV